MSDDRETVKGVVGFIKPKPGRVTYYSFKIEDGDWYGTGKVDPESVGITKGAYVEFESYTNAGGYLQCDTKTVLAQDLEAAAESKPAANKAKAKFDARGAVINWHSSRNAAIELAKAAATAGALDLGKKNELENLMIYVNKMTLTFFDQAREVEETGDAPEEFQG